MNKIRIEPADVSVVIQGPVFNDVCQNINYTKRACLSVRKHLPGAEIILSTWEGETTEGLDYDILVQSSDPGNFTFILSEKMDNDSSHYPMNINRQIISTLNGIKKSTRKYICKMRSDTILLGDNILKEYRKYNAPIKEPYSSILKRRVVTLSSVNPQRYFPFAFYLCDWFFFGEKNDIEYIWDIPLIEESSLHQRPADGLYYMDDNFGNEQYLWMGFLNKFMKVDIVNGKTLNKKILEESEKSYANCCIFLTAKKAQIKSLKIKESGYGARPCFSNAGLYTTNEWKKLYNKYGNGNLLIIPNPFENIVYMLVTWIRGIKKTKMSCIYYIIVNIYHKLR